MEAASVELNAKSDCTPPTYSIAAIIFHTAPVRARRYPPEDENDEGEMDHRSASNCRSRFCSEDALAPAVCGPAGGGEDLVCWV